MTDLESLQHYQSHSFLLWIWTWNLSKRRYHLEQLQWWTEIVFSVALKQNLEGNRQIEMDFLTIRETIVEYPKCQATSTGCRCVPLTRLLLVTSSPCLSRTFRLDWICSEIDNRIREVVGRSSREDSLRLSVRISHHNRGRSTGSRHPGFQFFTLSTSGAEKQKQFGVTQSNTNVWGQLKTNLWPLWAGDKQLLQGEKFTANHCHDVVSFHGSFRSRKTNYPTFCQAWPFQSFAYKPESRSCKDEQ